MMLDPWAFFGIRDPGPDGALPTVEQGRLLRIAAVPQQGSRQQAAALIEAVDSRRRLGLCSYRQACDLTAIGHPPKPYTRREAARLIAAEFEWEGAGSPGDVWGEMDCMGYEGDY